MYLCINIVPGYRYFWFSSYCRSNCHPEIARHLRRHYQRPAFLPDNSESSNLDWLFMGGFGSGADVHVSIHTIFTWYLELVKDILQENNFHWNFSAWNLNWYWSCIIRIQGYVVPTYLARISKSANKFGQWIMLVVKIVYSFATRTGNGHVLFDVIDHMAKWQSEFTKIKQCNVIKWSIYTIHDNNTSMWRTQGVLQLVGHILWMSGITSQYFLYWDEDKVHYCTKCWFDINIIDFIENCRNIMTKSKSQYYIDQTVE